MEEVAEELLVVEEEVGLVKEQFLLGEIQLLGQMVHLAEVEDFNQQAPYKDLLFTAVAEEVEVAHIQEEVPYMVEAVALLVLPTQGFLILEEMVRITLLQPLLQAEVADLLLT